MNTVFKALAHPVRRDILKRLRGGPLAAGVIASAYQVTAPTMSGHLAALKEAGLVDAERSGTTIRYRLNVSVLEEATAALMDLMQLGETTEETGDGAVRSGDKRGAVKRDGGAGPVG
ncbi:MAG: metalloregulator ArsR/SmtB family transcription factor [Caulobacterales bacterium]